MRTALVIPVGSGREENLAACIESVLAQTFQPFLVVLVLDGPEASAVGSRIGGVRPPIVMVQAPKHEPGAEQPRNRGVREVCRLSEKAAVPIDSVWFLDSDVIVAADALECFSTAWDSDPGRVLVGPYEWMPTGHREPMPELKNDPRWPSFDAHESSERVTNDLSAGLACFGGNLVWPIEDFVRIGGFWNELHHGRCEDGELGLRAVACGVPISFVRDARGWHIDHPVNHEEKLRRNERDVPMLNERHPWVEGEGQFVVEEDGKRFNTRCTCGVVFNTMEIWKHQAECEA